MKKVLYILILIFLINMGCEKSNSQNKIIKNVDVAGKYVQQTKKGVQEPTILVINKNGNFNKTINLCSEFGVIEGRWTTENDILKIKIEKADFDIINDDKITIFFKISNSKLVLLKKEPDRSIGCDLYINDIYFKE